MQTANATIQRASGADAAAIASIIADVVREPNPVGFSQAMDEEQTRGWVKRLGDQGCIFLATIDGRPAAFGALDFNTEIPETGTLGVWVLPQFRRRGLATSLGEHILDFAREAGYKRIIGRLPKDNEPALSFLSGLGALVPLQNPEMRFELPL
jgi:GNAT superfamily N-acetyltransferase